MKEFIVDVWEVRKRKLYGEDACPTIINSVRPWLEMQGLSLGVEGSGLVSHTYCIIIEFTSGGKVNANGQ